MKNLIILCISLGLLAVLAHEPTTEDFTTFTYEEAIELALESRPEIDDLEDAISDLRDTRRDLREMLSHSAWLSTTQVTELRRHVEEIDRQIEELNLDIRIIELRAEQTLRNILFDIVTTAIDIESMESTLIVSNENYRRANTLYQLRMISANELRRARSSLAQDEMNLVNLHFTKANSQANLNLLLGQPVYQQTVVYFERVLSNPPENLTQHITRSVSQSPTIRQMQINTTRQRIALNAHNERCNITPWHDCDTHVQLREAYDRARRNQSLETRRIETALRIAHSNAEQLRNQEHAIKLELYQAIENLEIAQLSLELGRSTQFEIVIAQNNTRIVELDVERVLYRQWVLQLTLDNPALL